LAAKAIRILLVTTARRVVGLRTEVTRDQNAGQSRDTVHQSTNIWEKQKLINILIKEEVKTRLKSGNACFDTVQDVPPSVCFQNK
jgi:hypothetical protein